MAVHRIDGILCELPLTRHILQHLTGATVPLPVTKCLLVLMVLEWGRERGERKREEERQRLVG
jgi:hypothetical protein